jgi:acyl-CoA reductase-like NAD-dependent aldehyde dehydrogenase
MTVIDLPRTTEQTRESVRLARITADLEAIVVRLQNPQGWGKLLEDERSRLLSERADLLRQGARLTATSVLGA